jgi:hypothetical protein
MGGASAEQVGSDCSAPRQCLPLSRHSLAVQRMPAFRVFGFAEFFPENRGRPLLGTLLSSQHEGDGGINAVASRRAVRVVRSRPACHRKSNYALLGDCETAALVGSNGSIDWLCWPRFDSCACFAALLGGPEHGRWLITTTDKAVSVSRHYRDDTLILETDFETADGTVTLVGFMPPRGETSDVIRIVVGRRVPWVTRKEDGGLLAVSGPDMVALRTPVRLRGKDFTTFGDFTVSAGETVPFVLTYSASHLSPPPPIDAGQALADREKILAPLDKPLHQRGQGGSRCPPFTHHTEGVNLPSDRRYRRRSHHIPARTTRRSAQLGLSLLLVAGTPPYFPRADERGLLRRSTIMAGVAVARHGRPAIASANHVRPAGRAAPNGMGDPLAAGL